MNTLAWDVQMKRSQASTDEQVYTARNKDY